MGILGSTHTAMRGEDTTPIWTADAMGDQALELRRSDADSRVVQMHRQGSPWTTQRHQHDGREPAVLPT